MRFNIGPFNFYAAMPFGIGVGPVFNNESGANVELSLLTDQHTTIHLKGKTKRNTEGHFAQPPVWSFDTPSIVAFGPSVDGLSCTVISRLETGTATLTVDDVDNPASPPITFNITVVERPIVTLDAEIDEPADNE